MADYYPLLARAVAALPNSSRDARAAIYDRARKALIGQLRSIQPPVSEADIDVENRALDDAIARLEAELAAENPGAAASVSPPALPPVSPPVSPPAPPIAPAPPSGAAARPPSPPPPSPARAAPAPPPPRQPPRQLTTEPPPPPPPRGAPPTGGLKPPPPPPAAKAAPPEPPRPGTGPSAGAYAGAVVGATAAAQAPPSGPPSSGPPSSGPAPAAPVNIRLPGGPRGGDPDARERSRPAAPMPPPPRRSGARQFLVWLPIVLVIAGGVGFAAWTLRVPQQEFVRTQAERATTQQPATKIEERAGAAGQAGQSGQAAQQPAAAPARPAETPSQTAQAPVAPAAPPVQPAQPPAQPAAPPAQPAAPVAQRSAILVQAAVGDEQNVETHIGTTVWRLEESRRPNANGMPALRADVDLPGVGMRLIFLVEKNNDPTLRASHMLTFRFLPREGSTLPAIAEIGPPQMRNETAPAVEPLASAQAKITERIFIAALNAEPAFATRNLETMRSRGWFDFPLRLVDGRLAKITIEKGTPGDRLLTQAIEEWQR